ncbi:hypothetical protein Hbal_0830 [Hirschia baltica ATCC 49814]|uniref:Uncharacterized protein n=2 Tax=Hirschia TaxID=2723 RepID=C6XQ07_HIRBI|nr:hypothetical protein Hbal_0830 [Hirschia baltica ATCC 49814]
MVASLFVAFSCIGCGSSTVSTEALSTSVHAGPVEYISTEAPVQIVAAQLEQSLHSHSKLVSTSANWAVSNDVLRYKSRLDLSPATLKRATEEVYAGAWEFSAPLDKAGFDLDLSVSPHARVEKTAVHESRQAGAEVRLGQIADRVDQRGKAVRVDSWYMFVGTDNEALCWDVGDNGANFKGVALRDQVTVGDWQAGIAFHKAGGELSIGLTRRETRFEDFKTTSDIAAISFTMRR